MNDTKETKELPRIKQISIALYDREADRAIALHDGNISYKEIFLAGVTALENRD